MSDLARQGVTEPLERDDFAAGELMSAHPPIWRHSNKHVVFDIACPPGATHGGRLAYSRWTAMSSPATFERARALALVSARPGFFDYVAAIDTPNRNRLACQLRRPAPLCRVRQLALRAG